MSSTSPAPPSQLDVPPPGASSPQLLTRLTEAIARGLRTTRVLQETLGIDHHTVLQTIDAGRWLGLLTDEEHLWLTPLGLEYAYGERRRPHIYARAVWTNPFIRALVHRSSTTTRPAGSETIRPEPPTRDDITRAIRDAEPSLTPDAVNRRAEAVWGLVGAALNRPEASTTLAQQLDLPISLPTPSPTPPQFALDWGLRRNPDVYRYLLCTLLDYGELTLGQLRALLDRARVREAPIGGYVELAIARGDARRLEERLVVTTEASRHRDLAETTPSIILSDPGYRLWLDDLLLAAHDRHAALRRENLDGLYRHWDRRLFGHPASADSLTEDLDALLMDRSLESFPTRGDPGPEPIACSEPFLDCWRKRRLAIGLPPYLLSLHGGLTATNNALTSARRGTGDVAIPGLAHRPLRVHGGLLHPGEPLPRVVPDERTLRQRLLMHAPYATLTTALLLLHRMEPSFLELVHKRGRWEVRVEGSPFGSPFDVIERYAEHRGWMVCRRPRNPIGPRDLLKLLERQQVAMLVGDRAVLSEPFFSQLRQEPEELEIHLRLRPLAEDIADYLLAQVQDEEAP